MPITHEQLINYRGGPIMGTITCDTLEHASQPIPLPSVRNVDDFAAGMREIVCSAPLRTGNTASNFLDERFSQSPTFPRIRNNSAYTMDVDSVRNILEGMAQQNTVMREPDRQLRPMSRSDILRKLEDDYRRWEVERIKKLISSKATIRYRIEVK